MDWEIARNIVIAAIGMTSFIEFGYQVIIQDKPGNCLLDDLREMGED